MHPTLRWASVSAGADYTCGVTADGEGWCWGAPGHGQLGGGDIGSSGDTSGRVAVEGRWALLRADANLATLDPGSTCGVTADGRLRCWGDDAHGQLGRGTGGGRARPSPARADHGWRTVSLGYRGGCGIGDDGDLWCWGFNNDGRVGDGTEIDRAAPVRIGARGGWRAVATSGDRSCAVRDDGTLWCWGDDFHYRDEGRPPSPERLAPRRVGTDDDWADVAVGSDHTCALKTDGSLWCAGSNDDGQLGRPGLASSPSFVRIGEERDWHRVVASVDATCALDAGGELWCWGADGGGKLGNGPEQGDQARPGPVAGARRWTSVCAGISYACGLDDGGALWCWGLDVLARTGDDPPRERQRPEQVGGERRWQAVSCGKGHVCTLDPEGAAWCWGRNDDGELGDGTRTDRAAPTRVAGGLGAWRKVAAASDGTCGIDVDGRLWCWGTNERGALANGEAWRASPAPLAWPPGLD